MYHIEKYKETDLLSHLICDNYNMLLVMSRFNIPLGFGDQTIAHVCQKNSVDVSTFLAVVNLLVNEEKEEPISYSLLSAPSLMDYLINSHSYFLDFRFPAIRKKLTEALDCSKDKISALIIRYYDEYVAEVRKHMAYEERTVFPYVESILNNSPQGNYSIDIFSSKHDNIDNKLSELKNIIIKYYPAKSSNELNSTLFDIFSCANDLLSHTEVEDSLFIPLIRQLEKHSLK